VREYREPFRTFGSREEKNSQARGAWFNLGAWLPW
jgi:hypothetical protein